jgi:AraC-like DNA-binding protein
MATLTWSPRGPLRPYIDHFWWGRRDAPSAQQEHMLPTGAPYLIVALHEDPIEWSAAAQPDHWHAWRHGVFHGPQSTYYQSGNKPAGVVMGVAFRPGAAGDLLGVPMSELFDQHIPLDALWGARGRLLQERLAWSADPAAAFEVMERELLARLQRPLLIHPAVACTLASSGTAVKAGGIERVRERTGYSHRRFIELFRTAMGLAPKQYFRIKRFGAVVERLARGETGLADLAAREGYADQAHLTREFRELSGVAPTSFRPRGPDSAHHHVRG